MVRFTSLAPLRVEEALQILDIDSLHAAVVNCIVTALAIVAFARLQLLLKLFGLSVKTDFRQKQLSEVLLDVNSQVVMFSDLLFVALGGLRSQLCICAR